jgi:5-formyltetrahydrofolate cyclo-ligase
MIKSELRSIFKELRCSLSPEVREQYDAQIRNKLLQHIGALQHVAIFLPIERLCEIDLRPLLVNDEIHWYAPVSFFDDRRLEFSPISKHAEFSISEQGIPEPIHSTFINPEHLDIVIMPMLISDESGYRVGYGKGFYDNFLKRCSSNCIRIGVNYFSPVESISDTNCNDERIHFCITPD